jgi:N-acyl-D-aspartate/D-glutamate deacylase
MLFRALVAFLACGLAVAQEYDLLIRGARVADGTGAPWFVADVAVKQGRITAVGRLGQVSARRIVDAKQRILAPGFIDVHSAESSGPVLRTSPTHLTSSWTE